MYKLCKTEQSAQRQRQLEDGLLAAMLNQQYEDISISDLCDQMGVPRKSFYRYFASKDGALHALLDHRLMEYETRNAAAKGARGEQTLDLSCFFAFWLSQRTLLDALARSGLSGILVDRAIEASKENHVFGFRTQRNAGECQNLAASFVVCGLMNMVVRWHHDGYTQSPQEMAAMTRKILSQPLLPNL